MNDGLEVRHRCLYLFVLVGALLNRNARVYRECRTRNPRVQFWIRRLGGERTSAVVLHLRGTGDYRI